MRFLSLLTVVVLLQSCVATNKDEPIRDFVKHTTKPNAVLPAKYKADTTCVDGEKEGCNICANNVQKQFHKAASYEIDWSRQYTWAFDWTKVYDPENIIPKDSFLNNSLVKHVQGFSRTNSVIYPYVGTHSNYDKSDPEVIKGGVFVIAKTNSGLELVTLHKTKSAHPSGTHVIGDYLVYGDDDVLVFKKLSSIDQQINIPVKNPRAFGGGLGLAKLVNNKYFVITTGPGGDDKGIDRKNFFYTLGFKNGEPDSDLDYISFSKVVIPNGWSSNYKLSENLSVITECGTGDIYTIHSTGGVTKIPFTEKLAPFGKSSYWRLSKLENKSGALNLTAINYMQGPQNISSCNPRATGTVSVSKDNKLEFYCHQHSQARSGSTDHYSFKKGVLK